MKKCRISVDRLVSYSLSLPPPSPSQTPSLLLLLPLLLSLLLSPPLARSPFAHAHGRAPLTIRTWPPQPMALPFPFSTHRPPTPLAPFVSSARSMPSSAYPLPSHLTQTSTLGRPPTWTSSGAQSGTMSTSSATSAFTSSTTSRPLPRIHSGSRAPISTGQKTCSLAVRVPGRLSYRQVRIPCVSLARSFVLTR